METKLAVCDLMNARQFIGAIRDGIGKEEIEDHAKECQFCGYMFNMLKDSSAGEMPLAPDEIILINRFLSEKNGPFDHFWNFLIKLTNKYKTELEEKIELNNSAVVEVDSKVKSLQTDLTKLKESSRSSRLALFILILFSVVITITIITTIYYQYRQSRSSVSTGQINDSISKSYNQIDNLIDQYLAYLSNGNTIAAKQTIDSAGTKADRLFQQTADSYYQQLIAYYKQINDSEATDLLRARQRAIELEGSEAGDLYSLKLQETEKLLSAFKAHAADLEVDRFLIYKAKLLSKLAKYIDSGEIINPLLEKVSANNFRHLELKALIAKGENVSAFGDPDGGVSFYAEAFNKAEIIGAHDLMSKCAMVLAGLYYQSNQDTLALKYSSIGLSLPGSNKGNKIQLLQISAISSFNLGDRDAAYNYISMAESESVAHPFKYYLVLTNGFHALMLAEDDKASESKRILESARTELFNIQDLAARKNAEMFVDGYEAKIAGRTGDYETAITGYSKAISLFNQTDQDLYKVQLYEGLAFCYAKQNDLIKAREASEFALAIQRRARKNNVITNNLLTFSCQPK